MTNRLTVAAVVATAAAALTFAAAPARAANDVRTTEVSYADLNLASIAGQKTLNARIARAASDVCGPSSYDLRQRMAFNACRTKAIKDATTAVASRRGGAVLASR